jgi:HprK-related kinase A
MHAAVLERDGGALLIPAPSGSGKSTLCAALACSRWRLFSDETAIFAADGALRPNPRPVSLKNRSIELIRRLYPEAHIGRVISGVPKGEVAYMRAPRAAVERAREPARPVMVVKPVFEEGAAATARPLSRTDAFRMLMENAVNFSAMLRHGFDVLTATVERCGLYELRYSELPAAIDAIERLHRESSR